MKTLEICCALALLSPAGPLSCAPAYYVATGRCPTTTMLLGDFTLSAGSLAVSALAYELGREEHAAVAALAGLGLAVAANHAEVSCRK